MERGQKVVIYRIRRTIWLITPKMVSCIRESTNSIARQ